MISVPQFDAHGGHRWAEVFDRGSSGVQQLTGYCCQGCAEVIAPYVVICRPGDEPLFTGRYGIANVQASPHVGLKSGEAFEIDGRIAAMSYCRAR